MTVRVSGLTGNAGNIVVCLWSTATEGFPHCDKHQPARRVEMSAAAPFTTFKGLKSGVYAVSAFYDENGNGRLDSNFIGIPTESIATSNNPPVGFTTLPSFERSEFDLFRLDEIVI